MNKKVLVAALGVALAAPAFADSSNVVLYGRIHQSLVTQKVGNGASQTDVAGVASRLGVRGTEDLGGGLKAIFGFEMGLNSDEVAAATGNTRNAYVGLDMGQSGRLSVGVLDGTINAPLYNQIFKGITAINHDAGRAQFASDRGDVLRGTQRVGDAIGYSVNVANIQIDSRLSLQGVNAPTVASVPATVAGERSQRNFSIAATTKIGALDIGAGYEKDDYTNTAARAGQFDDRFQLVAGYQFGQLRVGGIVARNSFNQGGQVTSANDTENEYGLSAAYAVTPSSKVIGNYFNREQAGITNGDLRQYQVGYAYDFSKRTMAYAMYDRRDPNTQVSNNENKAVIFGIRHNF